MKLGLETNRYNDVSETLTTYLISKYKLLNSGAKIELITTAMLVDKSEIKETFEEFYKKCSSHVTRTNKMEGNFIF